jgi:hypothetical protein
MMGMIGWWWNMMINKTWCSSETMVMYCAWGRTVMTNYILLQVRGWPVWFSGHYSFVGWVDRNSRWPTKYGLMWYSTSIFLKVPLKNGEYIPKFWLWNYESKEIKKMMVNHRILGVSFFFRTRHQFKRRQVGKPRVQDET